LRVDVNVCRPDPFRVENVCRDNLESLDTILDDSADSDLEAYASAFSVTLFE
jgi:hypothetical protein